MKRYLEATTDAINWFSIQEWPPAEHQYWYKGIRIRVEPDETPLNLEQRIARLEKNLESIVNNVNENSKIATDNFRTIADSLNFRFNKV